MKRHRQNAGFTLIEMMLTVGLIALTATFVGFEACPVRLNVDWRECVHITLEDDDADPITNGDVTGDYWAIVGQNIIALQLTTDVNQWQLSKIACEPLDTCLGEW